MSRISIFISLLLFTTSTFADYQSGANALARGDYATAVREFRAAANQGDSSSQAQLGYLYYVGEGVPQDYAEAVRWYQMAANQGNVDAQYNLAVAYAFGEGVTQDYVQAARWYTQAAERGHATAQYSLAISYSFGEGVPQNSAEAVKWFARAAEQGYVRAQVQLGSKYHTGDGVALNYTEAVKWYRRAADRGNASAQYNLGTMYRSGKGVTQDYNQAVRWFRLAADQNYAAAQNELQSMERALAGASRTGAPRAQAPALSPPVQSTASTTFQQSDDILTLNESTSLMSDSAAPLEVDEIVNEPGLSDEDSAEIATFIADTLNEADEAPVEEPVTDADEAVAEEASSGGFFSNIFRRNRSDNEETETVAAADEVEDLPPVEDLSTDYDANTSEAIEETDPEETVTAIDEDAAEEQSSGGFFSNIFRRNRSDNEETETVAAADEVEDLPPVEDLSTDYDANTSEAIEEAEQEETVAAVDEDTAEDKPSSTGFFRGIFRLKRDEDTEAAEVVETEAAAVAEQTEEAPLVEDIPAAIEEDNEIIDDQPDGQIAEAETERKSPFGFLGGLFGRSNNAEEPDVDMEALEDEAPDLVDEAPVSVAEDSAESTIPDVAMEDETEVAMNEAEEEKSGFFGRLFGRNKNTEEAEIDTEALEDESLGQVNDESVSMVHESAGTTIPDDSMDEIDEAVNEPEEQRRGLFGRLFGGAREPVAEEQPQPEVEATQLPYEEDGYDPANAFTADPEEYQRGVMALENKNYEEAYLQFRSLAIIGDMESQYQLAALYYQGLGTQQDFFEAARWYKRSAEQGQVDAQYSLGNMFLMGEGISQNDTEAAFWYEKAAAQGHDSAKHNLDNLEKVASAQSEEMVVYEGEEDTRPGAEEPGEKKGFFSGLFGKNKEAEEADTATEATAGSGAIANESAQEDESKSGGFFSRIFKRGEDEPEEEEVVAAAPPVEQIEPPIEDVVRQTGMDFIEVEGATANPEGPSPQVAAAEPAVEPEEEKRGFFSRIFRRGDKAEETENTEIEKAPQQVAMVNTTPTSNVSAAAQSGVSEYEQGIAYSFGEGVPKDMEEAFRFFMLSAEQGYAPAQYKVGAAYAYGDGVTQDALEAANWYRKAAQQGYALAQRNLGIMYSSGTGIQQDKALAHAWYSILAENGNVMDVRRRDTLASELSESERARAEELKQNLITYINAR